MASLWPWGKTFLENQETEKSDLGQGRSVGGVALRVTSNWMWRHNLLDFLGDFDQELFISSGKNSTECYILHLKFSFFFFFTVKTIFFSFRFSPSLRRVMNQ